MPRTPELYQVAALIAVTLVLSSCAGGDVLATATFETLPGGGTLVRNTAGGVWGTRPEDRWTLEEDLRIGVVDGDAPYMFGSIRQVIPAAGERIWVMDSQAFELRLFGPDGAFLLAVGRRGDGPGEFSANPCAFAGPNGEVWVEDSRRRWQAFDIQGELVRSIEATSNLGCGIRRWTPDGIFLAVNTGRIDPITMSTSGYFREHRLSAEGDLVQGDSLGQPDIPEAERVSWMDAEGRRRIVSIVPFTHRPTWVVGPLGDYWATDGAGTYSIRKESMRGDTLLILERPHTPVAIPAEVHNREIEEFRPEGMTADGGFDESRVPTTYAPFERMIPANDGSLWVRREVGDRQYALDVFTAEGVYLGEVGLPPDFARMTIREITPDRIYATAVDDLEVQFVVRLAIRKP